MTMNDIGNRAHFMKHSKVRCGVGDSDKILHRGSILNNTRSVLSIILYKSIFLHFVHHGTKFYDKYIKSDDRKKYIDYDGSGIFTKQMVKNLYSAKYQKTCSNRYYEIIKIDHIKYTRIRRMYLERKRKATGFVYLKGSPYRDDKGSSQIRSYLNDEIISAAPIVGKKFTDWICIDSVHIEG